MATDSTHDAWRRKRFATWLVTNGVTVHVSPADSVARLSDGGCGCCADVIVPPAEFTDLMDEVIDEVVLAHTRAKGTPSGEG